MFLIIKMDYKGRNINLSRIREIIAVRAKGLIQVLSDKWISFLMEKKTLKKFAKNYGNFSVLADYKIYQIDNLKNESNVLFGEIVKFVFNLPKKAVRVLLDGEENICKKVIKRHLRMDSSEFFTAGLGSCDYHWNFEENPPKKIGKFDLIISQAIIEHLIDPAKHVSDLVLLLKKDGYLILHSVLPGFDYHRFPIDTLRFYPDWFEEMARKLNLIVEEKYLRGSHLFYVYKKPSRS